MSNTTVSLDYTTPTHTPALNTHLTEQVAAAVAKSKRPNTLRAYKSDLAAFSSWCVSNGLTALPASPDTVAAYLADQVARGLKVSTVRRHLATISKAHRLAGYSHERNPATYELVKDALAGLRNDHGAAPDQAPGLTPDQLDMALTAISTALPAAYGREQRPDLVGLRDRALLVVGWCAALRRSELAQLRWGQITWEAGGVVLLLEGSKTDKQGEGQRVGIPAEPDSVLCPVEALRAWQAACEQRGVWAKDKWQPAVADDQPVFRQVNRHSHLGAALSPHSVGAIISQRCAAVGLVGYTGHSLRRGLIQAAVLAGKDDSDTMRTSRHRSYAQYAKYKNDAGLLERAASKGLRGKQH